MKNKEQLKLKNSWTMPSEPANGPALMAAHARKMMLITVFPVREKRGHPPEVKQRETGKGTLPTQESDQ